MIIFVLYIRHNMEFLHEYHDILIGNTPLQLQRFLYEQVDWNHRMIAIRGPRGTGKTTLLLQRIKKHHKNHRSEALYLTAEHPYFYTHTLFDTAATFYKMGGRYLFIDEVHKYANWSRELKVIYDGFPELKVVFSASSALDIYKGGADLSRRVVTYMLPGLSFREYLGFAQKKSFPTISFEFLLNNHRECSQAVTSKLIVLPLFKEYLRTGYLPILLETKGRDYLVRMTQMINAVVDSDLAYIDGYNAGTSLKVKKLLGVLAESVPFKPNVAALSRKLEISRDSVYNYLMHLRDAHLLNFLNREGKGVSVLQKPEKLFLENTNLAYALKEHPEIGNIRETFLLNQLINVGLTITAPEAGDFLVNGQTVIEVGGKHKKGNQVYSPEGSAIIASDGIENGFGNRIPLWLFGFLY